MLIYDNAECVEKIVSHLPQSGGRVIITSRKKEWPFQHVEVDALNDSEAVELMTHLSGSDSEDSSNELAQMLGRLPVRLV